MDKRSSISGSQPDIIERLKLEYELEGLMKTHEERKQYLANLRQQKEELKKNCEEIFEQHHNLEINSKKYESPEVVEKAEELMKEVQQQEAAIRRMSQEHTELVQRKEEMELEIQRFKPYYDFLDRVCKLTKFKNVEEMADRFENLFQIRDQLIQKEKQKKEHLEQQKKELQELKDLHELTCLQKTNELAQLQTELEEEQKWKHIQETASKKTLELGQIKMATLTLYESIGGRVGAEGVAIDDTEKQLDEIQTFILDNNDIVEQYWQLQVKDE